MKKKSMQPRTKPRKRTFYIVLSWQYGMLVSETANSLEEAKVMKSYIRDDGFKFVKIVKFDAEM